jgi:membrane protease YdiL (CAAX protease family)
MTLIAIVGWPLFTLSFLFWIIVPRRLREGKLVHKGIPLASITPTDADRLAIRAAQIMFLFVVMEVLVVGVTQKLGLHISEMWSETMGGLLTVAGVFGLQYVPVMGKQIRLEYIGVSARDLGKNILLGVVGFVAEFPLALIVAVISTELLKWIPQGSHPAIEQLMKHPNASTVAAVVIAGSIVAPFWEEIVFRGLLFPGSSRLLGSMVSGLILSSFMFASSHPQGITMWLPLAFVGAASGVLSNYSRSLVPGMVMHSLHNAALFAVFLLMS